MDALVQRLTLENFLSRPDLEESPAWEYAGDQALRKPMPKFRHSLLQKILLGTVDCLPSRYLVLPELRCTFGGRSLVPDIAVIAWEKIRFNDLGEPEDNFRQAPDWSLEILSPDQGAGRVIDNLLFCLQHGTQLGWLVDPQDYAVLVLAPPQEIRVFRGAQRLPVLPDMALELTPEGIFQGLRLGANPE
jgi:Uma2 family endonuclease